MTRFATAALVAALLGAAVGAYAELVPAPASPAKPSANRRPVVRITGHAVGLHPGATTILRARVHNRAAYPVQLLWVKAEVKPASRACEGSNLHSRRTRPRWLIESHRTRKLQIKVRMAASAPDACQNARFPLRYSARAVPAWRRAVHRESAP